MLSFNTIFIILAAFIVLISGEVRFINAKGTEYDPPFVNFERCELKLLQRGVVDMNLLAKIHELPISNVTINLSLNKRANGYKPFLYNVTVNFCQFFNRRAKYPFIKLVFDAFTQYSNVNHSCPYDHDIIVRNWILKAKAFRLLPLPSGDYALILKVAAYNDWKVDVKLYFYVKE